VLLIEDDPDDALLIEEALEEAEDCSFTILRVERIKTALNLLLRPNEFDLVLLDLNLPDSHGIDTFIYLHSSHIPLPIIVVTGSLDANIKSRLFRLGVHGYLVKGVDDLTQLPQMIMGKLTRNTVPHGSPAE
jgi:response regulator of citrate/malate metabolism